MEFAFFTRLQLGRFSIKEMLFVLCIPFLFYFHESAHHSRKTEKLITFFCFGDFANLEVSLAYSGLSADDDDGKGDAERGAGKQPEIFHIFVLLFRPFFFRV